MTTPTTETGIVELLPCPFCGTSDLDPTPAAVGVWHPTNDCVLSGRLLSKAAWNARAAMPSQANETGIVEKVAREVTERLWPLLGGNHTDAELWGEIGEAVLDGTRAAIAAMPDSTQLLQTAWQPIETFTEPTAPSSGNGVLVADKDGTVGEAYFRNFGDGDDGWWWSNTTWGDYPEPERPNNPTLWQPLPEPPAQFRAQEQRP